MLRLISSYNHPGDGKMKVRITYDWERIEVPTNMVNITVGPNDGGGVLNDWLPAEDAHGVVTGFSFGTQQEERTGTQARMS